MFVWATELNAAKNNIPIWQLKSKWNETKPNQNPSKNQTRSHSKTPLTIFMISFIFSCLIAINWKLKFLLYKMIPTFYTKFKETRFTLNVQYTFHFWYIIFLFFRFKLKFKFKLKFSFWIRGAKWKIIYKFIVNIEISTEFNENVFVFYFSSYFVFILFFSDFKS